MKNIETTSSETLVSQKMPEIHHLTQYEIDTLRTQFANDMVLAAPDLGTHNLADEFAVSLFKSFEVNDEVTLRDIVEKGKEQFYQVGWDTLGPIAVSFVNAVLKESGGGYIVFPARDATPFYHIAMTLTEQNPELYPDNLKLCNPVFNRKTWGVDDEQDVNDPVTEVSDPLVQQLLGQVGLRSGEPVTFVEVGAWGSMVNSMKDAMEHGTMPKKDFNVYFLFTHMPEYIYGYINKHAGNVGLGSLEAISDSFETLPKYFMRPTELVEKNGLVEASLEGKIINSPLLYEWCQSTLAGFIDAAKGFAGSESDSPESHIAKLKELSKVAQRGYFNGMLPKHTETWSEGEQWKLNWKWGKTLPLGEGAKDV